MYLLKEAQSTYLGGSLSEHDIIASRKQVPGHVLQRRGWWWCCKLTTHQVSRLCGEGWTEPRSRQMADRRQLAPLLTTSTTPLQPHHYILLVLEYQEVKVVLTWGFTLPNKKYEFNLHNLQRGARRSSNSQSLFSLTAFTEYSE